MQRKKKKKPAKPVKDGIWYRYTKKTFLFLIILKEKKKKKKKHAIEHRKGGVCRLIRNL